MDRDVRAASPGKCPRCGMTLVLGIPESVEYPLTLRYNPAHIRPRQTVDLRFEIRDPKTGRAVQDFEVVHEKLFHLFIVSEDLDFFVHDHPVQGADGVFHLQTILPKPGMYRLLCDFYPKGGTPQLLAKTLLIPAAQAPLLLPELKLAPDLSPKHAANLDVELATDPEHPIAGMKTLLFFRLKPADGIEPYLGAWGHMLAVSDDLIDMIHNHPFLANGGPQIQFNLIFPRARTYRIWVQFQRQGVVNTAVFDVPVSALQ